VRLIRASVATKIEGEEFDRRMTACQVMRGCMFDEAILLSLAAILGIQMGGGAYEALVIYPLWRQDPQPETLVSKIKASGQYNAGRRFWPLVSPIVFILGVVNLIVAWRRTGDAQTLWVVASALVILESLFTYGYFAPVMVFRFYRAEKIPAKALKKSVRTWTTLSGLRVPIALAAWAMLVMVIGRNYCGF